MLWFEIPKWEKVWENQHQANVQLELEFKSRKYFSFFSPMSDTRVSRRISKFVSDEAFIGASFFPLDEAYAYSTSYASDLKPYRPYMVIVVSVINIAMFIISIVLNKGFEPANKNPLFGPSANVLLGLGAKRTKEIVDDGEWWRLITAIFLHGGVIHLVLNQLFLFYIGLPLERIYGTLRISIIYFFSGIGGNLLSAVFLPNVITVGASGSLFALFGVLVIDLAQNYSAIKRRRYEAIKLTIIIVLSLLFGALFPLIDNFVHFGGFMCGIFISLALIPSLQVSSHCSRGLLAIIGGVLYGIWVITLSIILTTSVSGQDWCPACVTINCAFSCGWVIE